MSFINQPEPSADISVNTLTTDFKADVIAAELIENGIPAENVIMFPLGGFQRPFRKDVEAVTEYISESDNKEYYLVKMHRDGIYDLLPEGLFHRAISTKDAKSEQEISEAIERHQVEERDARRFFLPFEAAIHQLRVEMTLYENRLDKKGHYSDLLDIFADHWEIFRYLNVRQSNIFLQVLPFIHELRDNHRLIERLLQMIFDLPCSIALQQKPPTQLPVSIVSIMGLSRLGVDLIISNGEYYDGEDEVLVNIGPLEDKEMDDLAPGSENEKILRLLFDYLLPAHMDIAVNLIQNTELQTTRLQDKEKITKSILGFSTYL